MLRRIVPLVALLVWCSPAAKAEDFFYTCCLGALNLNTSAAVGTLAGSVLVNINGVVTDEYVDKLWDFQCWHYFIGESTNSIYVVCDWPCCCDDCCGWCTTDCCWPIWIFPGYTPWTPVSYCCAGRSLVTVHKPPLPRAAAPRATKQRSPGTRRASAAVPVPVAKSAAPASTSRAQAQPSAAAARARASDVRPTSADSRTASAALAPPPVPAIAVAIAKTKAVTTKHHRAKPSTAAKPKPKPALRTTPPSAFQSPAPGTARSAAIPLSAVKSNRSSQGDRRETRSLTANVRAPSGSALAPQFPFSIRKPG